jgi:hypothetical protein
LVMAFVVGGDGAALLDRGGDVVDLDGPPVPLDDDVDDSGRELAMPSRKSTSNILDRPARRRLPDNVNVHVRLPRDAGVSLSVFIEVV